MSKLSGLWGLVGMAMLVAAPAHAVPLPSHAGSCAHGGGPALQVQIGGFKARRGTIRVQAYGGSPDSFFEKGRYIDRIDLSIATTGLQTVCVPVGRPGIYAVSVRHDLDGDRKTGRGDGGGMSGNPEISLTDLLFKRKPTADDVGVQVGRGVTVVPVTLRYIQVLTFRAIAPAEGR